MATWLSAACQLFLAKRRVSYDVQRVSDMKINQSDDILHKIPLNLLSDALGRSKALIRMVGKSLDVQDQGGCVELTDALTLMRYFASATGEQDALWEQLSAKLATAKSRELELAIALDIVRRERTSLSHQVEALSAQLGRADERSRRLEKQLHELTETFAYLVSQRDRLLAQTKMQSKASLRYDQGREVLYLERPVSL